MKVFFGTTTKELIEYKDLYFEIRQELIDAQCIILDDWLPFAYKKKVEDPKGSRNIKQIYRRIVKAIDEADFVVIEYTVPNFSSSHQINYALFRRKPVLVLRLQKDNSFADSYIDGVESEFLTIKDYKQKDIRSILREFIGFNSVKFGKKRYNIVLDNKHDFFLDWAANYYNKSRSELIRDALEAKIIKDTNFKEYLQ